jgi:PEP-CTERM/exosortase A-associated glycosyltransferase
MNTVDKKRSTDSGALESQGQKAFLARDYDLARRCLRAAIDAPEPKPSVWLWLSRAYLALQDIPAALAAILVYLDRDPSSPRGIMHLAGILRRQGERAQCVELLMALHARHEGNPELLSTIAAQLLDLEAYMEAAKVAKVLLDLRPRDENGVVARASRFAHQGKMRRAQEFIEKKLSRDPVTAALAKSRLLLKFGTAVDAWAAIEPLSSGHISSGPIINVALHLMQEGHLSLAAEAADRALQIAPSDPNVRRNRDRIVGEARVLRGAWRAPAWNDQPVVPVPGRILHVVGASAPYRQTGYTVRTQSIMRAQRAAGLDPQVVTPLGFPWRDGITTAKLAEEVDGIAHHRLVPFDGVGGIHYDRRSVMDLIPPRSDDRLSANAERLGTLGRSLRPAVLHAASDFRNALVAQAVGRSLGVPVVYEIRGFPGETWLSQSAANQTGAEAYQCQKERELQCAFEADRVVTLAEAMKRELIERGVPADTITVVPNAVDVEVFVPVARDAELAASLGIRADETVLGYISSMVPYEGIRFLIDATARLVSAGHSVRTLLVGDGPEREHLERHATGLGLSEQVIFTGRVPHAEILRYYGLIDVFVVPRTADRVSQLVTPLKPYEAMAMARALVVSGVPALEEMVVVGQTGLVFRPEDAEHLAAVVEPLITSRARREELGRAARDWVCQHRTWTENGRRYRELYEELGVPLTPDPASRDNAAALVQDINAY